MARSVAAFRGVFWSVISILIPTVVYFLVFLVTSRILTPEDFGAVALAASIMLFLFAAAPRRIANVSGIVLKAVKVR